MPKGKKLDLIGQKFSRLTVLENAPNRKNKRYVKCVCDCGNITEVRQENLVRKIQPTTSCGCFRIDRITTNNGATKHPLYSCWSHIINRCLNPHNPSYMDYGGRGITLCNKWKFFGQFAKDITTAIGLKPSKKYSLDRINNDGNYEPGNVRWADWSLQNKNQRVCKSIQNFSITELFNELTKRVGGTVL